MRQLSRRNIGTTAALLAVLSAAAISIEPLGHQLQLMRQKRAAQPRPVLASAGDIAEIASVLLPPLTLLPPDPPPPPGSSPVPAEPRPVVVSAEPACLQASPAPRCGSHLPQALQEPGLEEFAPRKLRDELRLANTSTAAFRLPALPHVVLASRAEMARLRSSAPAEFRERYPNAVGVAELSVPVLTPDRRHALVYLGFRCGGLCGAGYLYYLERGNHSWRVVRKEMLWVS